ncbi:helicase HerA domain-containing protein [Pyrobaculum aerophilum]|uniref:helicase HerA domain-containing protein n=1 Tax=Pyrobaculum aerophilum TaxID=13773 RepID=UPI002FD9E122
MKYYNRVLLLFAGGLLFVAVTAPQWPPIALLLIPLVLLHGEDFLVWLYSRFAPIEPIRIKHPDDERCAYDPRHRLYHWLWKVEPNRSLFGVESVEAIHELYNKLSLQRGEWLTYVTIGDEKFVRFTSRRFDPARVKQVEAVLNEFYVVTREGAWVGPLGAGRPLRKWPYLTAAFWLFYSFLGGAWVLFAVLPLWLWVVHRFINGYVEVPLIVRFTHRSLAESWPANRQILELLAGADARIYASMPRWAVSFADRPPTEVIKKFQRTYEGRDTGKRLVRLGELTPLLERISQHNERPILIFPFATADVHTQNVSHDYLAQAELWRLRDGVKALTGDLMRFPIFYGGQLLGKSRYITLAYDRFGRPVSVPIDALPNVHGVIVGISGMGKSWTVASWLKQLAREVGVVVIDPHGDYERWAELVGARVYKVPAELPEDLPDVLARSVWFVPVAAALRIDYKGPESLRSYLEEEAARKGFRPNFVKFEGRHIVFDISLIGQKDSAAQGFWATLLLIYILDKFTERKTERLEYVVLFDEVGVLDTLGIGDVLNRILKDMVRGGRKYGFAVWFVIQSATMLDRMLLETASIVLVLGGPMRSLKHSVDVLVLSPSDISYLTSALTPYESSLGGQPYAMGVLLLSPREIKYHVKIPLDPQLKPPRK